MKSFISKFLPAMTMMCMCLNASAYDFAFGGLYYNITDASSKTVAVTYKDANYNSYEGKVTIPTTVNYYSQSYTVTSIGDKAFLNCSKLQSITISGSVTSIGNSALWGCSSLTTLSFPNSVTSFGNSAIGDCTGLTSVTLPDKISQISNGMFNGCSSLTSVSIPNSVTSIGDAAFSDCCALTSISLSASTKSIGASAFQNCVSLASIIIPNSVSSIGDWAFGYCNSLSSVLIGKSVTSVGKSAFNACKGLKKSAYPKNLTNPFSYGLAITYDPKADIVEDGIVFGPNKSSILFALCTLIGDCVIPNTVTSIADKAFYECSTLGSVTIPNSVKTIGNSAFYGCKGFKSIILGNSVTSIGDNAFTNCTGLKKSAFPSTIAKPFTNGLAIKYEPTGAIVENGFVFAPGKSSILFASCTLAGEYVIPNSVKSIGNSAFYECASLTSVSIPNSVTEIGGFAFHNCSSLNEVNSLIEKPYATGSMFTISTLSTATLRVPKGTLALYKAVGQWNQFINIVESEGSSVNEIEMDGNDSKLIDVFTLQGATVLSNASHEQFDHLPAGHYIVKKGNSVKKVIK